MVLNVVYYVHMVAIHYFAPVEKKIYSHIGMSFAFLSMALFDIDYFLQVSVIQPSLVLGETDGISILSQFNAHGVFIVLEEIAFIMMSLSMLCMALVFAGQTKSEKAIHWIFTGNFVLNVISFAMIALSYGIFREYRFEVAAFSINWLALIVFRRMKIIGIIKVPSQVFCKRFAHGRLPTPRDAHHYYESGIHIAGRFLKLEKRIVLGIINVSNGTKFHPLSAHIRHLPFLCLSILQG